MSNGKTILIVEDEEMLRTVCKQKLESEGFAVLEAADGERGLSLASNNQPDLILLDIRMPNMTGFEMLKRLRAMGGWGQGVPVIFFTNIEPSSNDEVADVEGLEPTDYLIKSDTNLDKLAAKIKQHLGM